MIRRCVVFFLLLLAPLVRAQETYTNPIDVLVADPFALKHDGTYYLYGTTDTTRGFECWSSKNLVDWKSHGFAYRAAAGEWARDRFWAPEAFEHDGKFYLHGSAVHAGQSHRIILAAADAPTGPFKIVKAPWFEPKQAVIDSHVFKDDDGQLYLFYVMDCSEQECSEITVRKLGPDLMPVGEPAKCVRPSQNWEGTKWTEAPFVLRRGDTYFLMYSANGFMDPNYSIGYATSKSPMGPWTKVEFNPILSRTKTVTGPGHHCLTTSPDSKETFIVYHTHQQPDGRETWARQLAIDRISFVDTPTGPRISIEGPTHTPQLMPSGSMAIAGGRDDDFNGEELDEKLWTIFSERNRAWSVKDGWLRIRTQDGDTHEARSDLRNLFLQYAPTGDFVVTTRAKIKPERNYDQAFIYVWQDHNNYLRMGPVFDEKLMIALAQESDSTFETLATSEYLGDDTYMRIERRGNKYTFSASTDGQKWQQIGEPVEMDLVDLRVGIGGASPGSEQPVEAAFDFVKFEK